MSNKPWKICRMCKHVFQVESSRYFKCPKCGAHFTEPTSQSDAPRQCFSCKLQREREQAA